MRYRSRPAEIEAMQWVGDNDNEVIAFIREGTEDRTIAFRDQFWGTAKLWVEKSQAWAEIASGDYIVREPDGVGFYPVKGEIFEARWEPVPESSGR